MAIDLSTPYEQIFSGRANYEKTQLNKVLDALSRSYGKKGVSGRALSENEQQAIADMLERLGLFRGNLSLAETERKQTLADISGEREYNKTMTFAQWAEQEKRQKEQFAHEKEMLDLQHRWAEKQAEDERNRQRRAGIYSTLLSAGIGAATGGLFPTAIGATGSLAGMGKGALMGAPTTSWMLGTYPTMKKNEDYMTKILGYLAGNKDLGAEGLAKQLLNKEYP